MCDDSDEPIQVPLTQVQADWLARLAHAAYATHREQTPEHPDLPWMRACCDILDAV